MCMAMPSLHPQGEALIPANAIKQLTEISPTEEQDTPEISPTEEQDTPEPVELQPLKLGSMDDARPKRPKKREVKERGWAASVRAFSEL